MKKSVFLVVFLFPFFVFSQQNSVLSSGDWYKIAVNESGIHKITYDNLISYGIDVDNIDPKNLGLYGNKAGMLPESLEEAHYTDLQEMAIQIVGEADDSFDPDDYILFYGENPDVWDFDYASDQFKYQLNLYSDFTFYFITLGDELGKRIPLSMGSSSEPNNTIDTLDLLIHSEEELVNIARSGKRWLGASFTSSNPHTDLYYTEPYQFYADGHYLKTSLASQSTETQEFEIQVNGITYGDIQVHSSGNAYQKYKSSEFETTFSINDDYLAVTYIYSATNDSSIGWLDFTSLDLKIVPMVNEPQMCIISTENIGEGNVSQYTLQTDSPQILQVWDATDAMNVKDMELNIGTDEVWFNVENEILLKFFVFDGDYFMEPEFIGQVENQNLHATTPPDLLIVAHPDFLGQAQEIASFHENEDNMTVSTFTTDQVFNEFSSGAQDVTAIRNLVRLLKSGNSGTEYLLLFGDASYDYKDRVEVNTNFVPTFESLESANIVWSLPADVYFGIIDPDSEMPQIGIGRLPVKNETEAEIVTNKILSYNSESSFGPWKNEWMFIADNEDNNVHLNHAEVLVETADINQTSINFNKNYLDFYDITQTNDGPRIPEVNAEIEQTVNEGVFYVNYSGHGSTTYLAHERVLTKDNLATWSNIENLPLWVTGTCDVAWYDNPELTSLAEDITLFEDGGAIAFLGTSRPTFGSSNLMQNMAVVDMITDSEYEGEKRLGDLIRYSSIGGDNSAKWVLIGDPALKLALPELLVNTTMINGVPAEDYGDTIPPGSQLVLSGIITDQDENLQAGFNGPLYLKIYHPPMIRETMGSGGSQPVEIIVQDSVLVSGGSIVENGEFEISVWLPAQYMEGFGDLKLSWYANTDETDASGYYNQLVYGGEPAAVEEPNELLSRIKAYPTVFSNTIIVEMPMGNELENNFKIYNTMGQVVYANSKQLMQGSNTYQLPNMSKGMYIVNVKVGESSRNFKMFRN